MGRIEVCLLAALAVAGGCGGGSEHDHAHAGVSAAGSAATGALGVAGVAGSAGGAAGASGAGGAGASAALNPTFTRVWNEVLVAKGCAGEFCHGAGQGGMSMENQVDAYASLVGAIAAGPSCGTSGRVRVQPGDPAASLLYDKMSNLTPACGDAMPLGVKLEPDCIVNNPSVCTTQVELQLVRDWITAGAPND